MLGKKVKCKITGFEGIATAKIKYLNGCVQYCVKPKVGKDGKMPDGEYIDIGQLEIVGDGVNIKSKDVGGPQRDCPKY
jgi:hypothetical protein